jgi:hypothetical protein
MVTVRLILLLAQFYKIDSKTIDFVLAFPQAELDLKSECTSQLVSKLIQKWNQKVTSLSSTKSLYGLKQASLNWFKKLKQGLIGRGFHSSAFNPCLYFKKGMIIITYVDDCIIVSNLM